MVCWSEEKTTGPRGSVVLLCGGRRWWFCLHGGADGLELSDELAGASYGVVAADEVVHPKVVVALISPEHLEVR